jgi:propanediol dehydratase small subunit
MEPVDLGHARARLETLGRRARDLLGGSAVFSVAGAVAAAAGRPQLAFSFAFGAALAGAFWYLARSERAHLLTRLVAQGDAALVGEAEVFARKLAAPPMRLRLARGLERAAEAGRPGVHEYTWARPERVFDIREELLHLAAGFRDLAVAVTPASAALCRRMLCEAAASPLYNPKIPETELARLLRVIGDGLEGYRVRDFGEAT